MILYSGAIGLSFLSLLLILRFGPASKAMPSLAGTGYEGGWVSRVFHDLSSNVNLPLSHLLFQILVVLGFCRLCAYLFGKLGQTVVIAEIFAGILLGKSVFSWLWPAGFAYVFPDSSIQRLQYLSQVGLIFFMFVVGLELNLESVKKRASAAVLISHGSIVIPFVLGAALSLFLYRNYAPDGVAFSSFALFMGIAMSITAFPVLARILKEKNLTHTPLGAMALTCAAVDDVTAWCILAAVIGIVKAGGVGSAAGVLVMFMLYATLAIKVARPLLEKVLRPKLDGSFHREQFALVFITVLSSAFVAEVIGIHALFGAFLAGTIMPQSLSFRTNLIQRIEDISSVTLLPLFFALTGIRTQIGLMSSAADWAVCASIALVAIVGKAAGSAGAARLSGMSWRNSLAMGVLMNTRGLMELVVLNIGYDLGILSPTVFSMMVVMALVTTTMTSPLLEMLLLKRSSVKELPGKSMEV
jgi:Kef-type K+ transport system membrane component KefB